MSAHATEPLAAGVPSPALNAANVHDERGLSGGIGRCCGKLGQRPRRIALVLPDTAAKVSLMRFEKVPAKLQDLEQLIRWQMRKAAPFRIEDAQVSWLPAAALPGGGREYLVTLARRDIVESYERACEAAGVAAGHRRHRRASTRSTPCSPGRPSAATGCWSTSPPTTRRSRSSAART